MADMEKKAVRFELKSLTTEGTFSGYANVTGIKDRGNDIVHRGAFTRTLKSLNGKVPVFSFHDPTIVVGVANLEEDDHGLKVMEGKLNLETQSGRETHANLRFFADNGLKAEMSIGYIPIKWDYEGDIRHLHEVKLKEVSLLPPGFAMNPRSRVTAVKGGEGDGAPLVDDAALTEKMLSLEKQIEEMHNRLDGALPDEAPAPEPEADPQAKHSADDDDPAKDDDPTPEEHSSDVKEMLHEFVQQLNTITSKLKE